MDNRKLRRAKLSAFNKQLKDARFDNFENKTTVEAIEKFGKLSIGDFLGFFVNSIYSVQVYQRGEHKILGIRRHDERPICPWSHKQKIKSELIGENECAIEFFPPRSKLVDQANIYWIFTGPSVTTVFNEIGGIG